MMGNSDEYSLGYPNEKTTAMTEYRSHIHGS